MQTRRAIASPLTEESSVIVIDHADMTSANDNVFDPTLRPARDYSVPIRAFAVGFMVAGVVMMIERFWSLAS